MPTTHFRKGHETIVIAPPGTATILEVIAELAEVLVASSLATQDEVSELRLAVLSGNNWNEISRSTDTLDSLGITSESIVGFTFGDGDFTFESYT